MYVLETQPSSMNDILFYSMTTVNYNGNESESNFVPVTECQATLLFRQQKGRTLFFIKAHFVISFKHYVGDL